MMERSEAQRRKAFHMTPLQNNVLHLCWW